MSLKYNKRWYFIMILIGLCSIACEKGQGNKSNKEKILSTSVSEDWISLFDGKSFNGWHTYLRDTISDQWQISEGAMVYTPNPEKDQGINNLISDKKYESFELSIEWNISVDGNSGVFYGILEDEEYAVPYLTAPEIQIRDYTNLPEFDNNKQMTGAIFGLIGPKNKLLITTGEWHHFLIRIDRKRNEGKVSMDGEELFVYPLSGPDWKAMVDQSKFKDWKGFSSIESGHIGLQDHAHGVQFRNIKIKELN